MRGTLTQLFERCSAGEWSGATLAYAACAAPVSLVYRAGLALRPPLSQVQTPLRHSRLIVVSSPLIGGVGKTPLTALISQSLAAHGHRVAIVSLGYRRRGRGRMVIDTAHAPTAREIGDEAMVLWRETACPVHVDDDPGALIAALDSEQAADWIIFDDGVSRRWPQERRVIALSAGDLARPVRYLPLGRWRVAPSFISRASFVAISDRVAPTAEVETAHRERLRTWGYLGPVGWFQTQATELVREFPHGPAAAPDRRPFVFCGLGDPGRFLGMVRAQGLTPAGIRLFADHQDYTAELIAELVNAARKSGASWLLTTLKDIVKFQPDFAAAPVYTMRLGLRRTAGDDWLATLTETP
jgi:tetraacyldisaccharide 4'-kinase